MQKLRPKAQLFKKKKVVLVIIKQRLSEGAERKLHRTVGEDYYEQKQMPNRRLCLVYLVLTRSLEIQAHTEGSANLDETQGRPTASESRALLVIRGK